MKIFSVSCGEDADRIVEHVKWERSKLKFNLSDLLCFHCYESGEKINMEAEPKIFDEAWNHLNDESWRK